MRTEEKGGEREEKTRNVVYSKEIIKRKIVSWKWIFPGKKLKMIEGEGGNDKSNVVLVTALS